ncbi:Adenylate cyclase 1 [compost metagenome]
MFVDLRQWSGLSERQWPVDLSWVLDRYFELVGSAVQECGGVANQFIGDSVMAIFGLATDLPAAARQAIAAAVLIDQRMQAWGQTFSAQFGQRLEFGMGLHAGSVALGRVGFERTTSFTAVGEVVNTASRLQEYSKVAQARLVLSAQVADLAQVSDSLGTPQPVLVRGRSQPLDIFHVVRPAEHWAVLRPGGFSR